MKFLAGLILICFTFLSYGQSNSINGLAIDPTIQIEAENHFKSVEGFEEVNASNVGFQVFQNNLEFEFYENDSLVLSTEGKPRAVLFKSFYLWKGDTLVIDGAIGFFGGGGFSIRINNGKATVYHMLSSDDVPIYSYGVKTDMKLRLDVPCRHAKAIVSEIPLKGTGKIIYGYVEFESENYYSSDGAVNGKEISPRKQIRSNMKMYFRSGELKI